MVARHPRGFVAMMVVLAVLFWTGMGATALLAHQVFEGVPDRWMLSSVTKWHARRSSTTAKAVPAFTILKEQRFEVPLEQMSPHLRRAMLAIEDQRFYDHSGVDIIRVAGAAHRELAQGRQAEGASTITQQLARLSFLNRGEDVHRGSCRRWYLQALIENEYSKDQILELYLNKVYFGAGLYGAEAARSGYFGKHAPT